MWAKIAKYYPPWFEFIPLMVVIFTISITVIFYGRLPDTIPSHFGISGSPDAWGHKGMIILLPALSCGIYLQLLLLNWFLIISPEDPSKAAINLSAARKQKLGPERLEEIRSLTARLMWLLNTLTAMLFAVIVEATVKVSLGQQQGLGKEIWLILAALLIVVFIALIKTYQLSRIPKE